MPKKNGPGCCGCGCECSRCSGGNGPLQVSVSISGAGPPAGFTDKIDGTWTLDCIEECKWQYVIPGLSTCEHVCGGDIPESMTATLNSPGGSAATGGSCLSVGNYQLSTATTESDAALKARLGCGYLDPNVYGCSLPRGDGYRLGFEWGRNGEDWILGLYRNTGFGWSLRTAWIKELIGCGDFITPQTLPLRYDFDPCCDYSGTTWTVSGVGNKGDGDVSPLFIDLELLYVAGKARGEITVHNNLGDGERFEKDWTTATVDCSAWSSVSFSYQGAIGTGLSDCSLSNATVELTSL